MNAKQRRLLKREDERRARGAFMKVWNREVDNALSQLARQDARSLCLLLHGFGCTDCKRLPW